MIDLYEGASVIGRSATCTAPPASIAPPAAVVANFVRAILTDIVVLLSSPLREGAGQRRSSAHATERSNVAPGNGINQYIAAR
ncbi:hypothetical protein [Qipengyuania sp. YIM B01966]|uniref:hypothetical protein n=1 Tax=Qipengyuania sp. YIM B01966 TaxID=2778646 RepID=UPI0018F6EF5F|nr:hypothetical protein [Qipengyuania sp. YIM B01966]